jgi:hypothetical protein
VSRLRGDDPAQREQDDRRVDVLGVRAVRRHLECRSARTGGALRSASLRLPFSQKCRVTRTASVRGCTSRVPTNTDWKL